MLYKKELGVISKKEQKELDSLLMTIPEDDLADWNSRRAKNLKLHEKLINYVHNNVIDYYLIGRDD